MNRREFISASSLAVAGLAALGVSCRTAADRPLVVNRSKPRLAFNTANLVGRVSGYRYELSHWGEQHQKTIAATNEQAWRSICADIAGAGYQAVEVWEAHAAPESLNELKAKTWRQILRDYGLEPVAYAGGLRRETLQICQWMGIPHIDGGLRGLSPTAATALCREFGVAFNLENHPEKSVAEILRPIDGGNDWLGVCVDTGWLGTQGVVAPEAIQKLGRLVRHTHIKDIQQAGAHATCRLGTGVVNIPGVLAALKGIGYDGWYSWEDEPEDRNPMDLARWSMRYLKEHV